MNPANDSRLYRLRLLGTLQLEGEGVDLARLPRKARALLAYLAVIEPPQSRDELMEVFCPQASDPRQAIRSLLSRIRRSLHRDLLVAERERVAVHPDRLWVDARVFSDNLELGEITPETLALYRGEFLKGLSLPDAPAFELWLLGQRAYYSRLHEEGLSRFVIDLVRRGDYEQAIPHARRLVQGNPLQEGGHGMLIWLYARVGQRDNALAQYERCQALLREDLHTLPGPGLERLAADVRAGRLADLPPSPHRMPESPAGSAARPLLFVGRENELRQLQTAWAAARTAQGRAVLVSAPAGGGKSALVTTFLQSLAGVQAFAGRAYESGAGITYLPWTELLSRLLESVGLEATRPLGAPSREYLARLLPQLGESSAHAARPTAPIGGTDIQHVQMAVRDFLQPLAQPGLVLFLDDLQWADPASLQLFHFLARHAASTHLLLIGALRSGELHQAPALTALLGDLRRAGTLEIALDPLAEAPLERLVALRWPELMPRQQAQLVSLLHRWTGGSPFFVVEVVRELTLTGDLPRRLPLPRTVSELIARRLDQLTPDARDVIDVIAIFDDGMTQAQARQVSQHSEEATASAIDTGLQLGVLAVEDDGLPNRYRPRHDLMAEAIRRQVQPARRRLLHDRIAALLAQAAARLRGAAQRAAAARIVRHAQAGENFDLVLRWAPLAAEHAAGLHAYHEAAGAYQAAITAWEQAPAGDSQLAGFLIRLSLLGEYVNLPLDEHRALLQRARALLDEAPDPAVEALYDLGLATYYSRSADYALAIDAAQAGHDRFVRLDDHAAAGRCLVLLGQAHVRTSQNPAGRLALAQALSLFQAAQDSEGVGVCVGGIAWADLNLGRVESALRVLNEALADPQIAPLDRAHLYHTLAAAWTYYYHAEHMAHYASLAMDLFQQASYDQLANRSRVHMAQAARFQGNSATAQTIFLEVHQAALANHDLWVAGWIMQIFGAEALERGEVDSAAEYFARAHAIRQETGQQQNVVSDLAWLSRLKVAEGDLDQALDLTALAIEKLEAGRGAFYVWQTPDVYVSRAEALGAAGRADEARAAIQRAYEELQSFLSQIADAADRQRVLDAPASRRVITAWEQGAARPFHLKGPSG